MEAQRITDQEAANTEKDIEKEEFYKWFESRGLLSELRTYMRQLMVKALEDSNKSVKTSSTRKAATSPKLQAINLLLVDYLFHEDYLYTVSVFASEAQILESLPQYSRYVTETIQQHRWDPSCVPRFSRQETEDILDTLRLPPSHRDMQQATRLYQESQESLLTCVARTLASSHTFSPVRPAEGTELPLNQSQVGLQLWSQEMQNLLLMAGVKLQHIQRMHQKWQLIIKHEKQKAREECEKDQQAQQQVEWELRLREERSKLEQRERELNSLADQLSEVHQDISLRMVHLQDQSENLREREIQQQRERLLLDKGFCDVQKREESLKLAVDSLVKETVDTSTQPDKEVATSDASVQVGENVTLPGPQVRSAPVPGPQVASTHTQTVDTVGHHQLDLQLQEDQEKISELQQENMELRSHILQQRHRIDDLSNRAASLTTQLEESRVEHEPPPVLGPVIPQVPPQGIFIAPNFGFGNPQRKGAGEESLFTPRVQQAAPRPDGRRRPSRFAFSNNPNPTSEESSPTDEVVQNARARIRELEAESATVQRNYQAFQTRLLNSDSVMFPPPRTRDPFLALRRHDTVHPSTHFSPFHISSYLERPRNTHPLEEEDSSSDQSPVFRADRIENISNTRRFFVHRNIRHYDRWKQFKKKYQKLNNVTLNNRRNITSSEDEEENLKISRRKNEINKKSSEKSPTLIANEKSYCDKFHARINKAESEENHKVIRKKSNLMQDLPILDVAEKDSQTKEKSITIPRKKDKLNSKEDELRLEVEQSIKLIDSVKHLLEGQTLTNLVESGTFSNGSLAVESLPKDSDNNTQHETAVTETNSVLTVRKVDGVIKSETGNKNCKKDSDVGTTLKHNTCKDLETLINQKGSEIGLEEIEMVNEGGNSPLLLNIPAASIMTSNTNIASEERSIPLPDVAQEESEDRGTTSVTSASDIMRELNPSTTSSDSIVSTGTGYVNDSHSSDFWN